MTRLHISSWVVALLCGLAFTACSQNTKSETAATGTNASSGAGSQEVRQVVKRVEAKLQQGKDKEADFAAELKEFEEVINKLKTSAPESAAEAAFMRALLYIQVMENAEKGAELMRVLKKDFPKTKFGQEADQVIASIERQEKAKLVQAKLVPGSKFPEFNEKDINGKPFTLANYTGKVVLVDFWATWCGPCRAELPNVLETYEKFHGKGFEVMGISLDDDKTKLTDFLKDKKIPWQQYFDGKGWENKLSQEYGVTGIPATYLIDGEGKIIARDLYGPDLGIAVEKALAKK
jgi:peroxiredoxin